MKPILDQLRKNRELYDFFRKIYGPTIGLWWLKDFYVKNIGFHNGKKRLKTLSTKQTNQLLINKIRSKRPFMLARYGTGDFRCLFHDKDFDLLCFYSGFFPQDKRLLKRFREEYLKSSKMIDLLSIILYRNQFRNKIKLIRKLPNIEYLIKGPSLGTIIGEKNSWLNSLENKKVLIIHPFKKTIEYQYKKRDKLKILPKLKRLEVIRAVQTIAGNKDKRFETWFDALEYMKKQIDKKDFDVALIGCGAYGLPLAAHIKSKGKQAIQLAGSTQLLFGIMGKRWEKFKEIKTNKYWVRPLKEDFPKDFNKIEGGCYW